MLFRSCPERPPSPPPQPKTPLRSLERLKAKIGAAGLEPCDLVPALVVHEALGLVMAAGFWASCYALQPSKRLSAATNLRPPSPLAASWARSLETARARLRSRRGLLARADPARATVGLAESLVLRASIKPATFVFKIWASATIVSGAKRVLAANKRVMATDKRMER